MSFLLFKNHVILIILEVKMMIKKILKVFLILVMIGIVGLLSYIWSIFVWLMELVPL